MGGRAVIAALSSVALAAGCSFALDGPPSPYRASEPPRCSSSERARGVPVLDAFAAGGAAAGAVMLARAPSKGSCSASTDTCESIKQLFYTGAALLLFTTAVYTTAAVVGFRRTSRCRAAMAEYKRHLALRARHLNRRDATGARVLLVAAARSRNIERALLAGDPIEFDRLTPRAFDARVAGDSLPRYSVLVLVDHSPPALPGQRLNVLSFHAAGPHAPLRLRQELPTAVVDQVKTDHPVVRGLSLVGVVFGPAWALAVDPARGEVALAAAGAHPVIAAVGSGRGRTVACGFRPDETPWAGSPDFELFVHNAVDWLAASPETEKTQLGPDAE